MAQVAVRFFGGPFDGQVQKADRDLAHRTLRLPYMPPLGDLFDPARSVLEPEPLRTSEYRYVCRWFRIDADGEPDILGPELVDMEWQPPHELVEAHRALNRLRVGWGIGTVAFAELRPAWRHSPPWPLAAEGPSAVRR